MENKIQPKTQPIFTQKALLRLIIPLVIESFLGMTIGFVGMIMVASAGEEAVSSVSLVDNINFLILVFIGALATGGAIIIAQNIGKGAIENARATAKQLLYTTVFTSIALMVISLIGNEFLLSAIFGDIEPIVMQYARTYFLITAISYPFVAVLNSVSSIFRSMGITKTPMLVTLLMSIINILCCAVLIFIFHMGVLGAAIAVLVSRAVASAAMLLLIRNRRNTIYLVRIFVPKLNFGTIKNILKVGIPSGLDSGVFQLGKLLIQSLIATFGTASIAANAVVGQIMTIVYIPGGAISLAIITVVGQCVGAGDFEQAASYAKRLIKYSYIATASLCAGTMLLSGQLLTIFNLSPEANDISIAVLYYTCIFSALFHPLAFSMPNALRAAGDVRFTMVASIVTMWLVRIIMSYVIEYTLKLGLMSVWISMYSDWFVRGVIYYMRFINGKWRSKKVV